MTASSMRRHRIVGHQRHADSRLHRGEAEKIAARDRLLDMLRVEPLDAADQADRIGRPIVVVGIHPQRHVRPDRLAHRLHPREIPGDGLADLELDGAMTLPGLLDRDGGHPFRLVDPDHRPDHRHLAAQATAEQIVHRNAQLARLQIVQRHVDPGLGPDPALERRGDAGIGERALLDRHADQRRRRRTGDGADDLLGELLGLARGCRDDLRHPIEAGLVGAQAQEHRMMRPGRALGDAERPQAGHRQRDGVDRRDLDPRRHQFVPGAVRRGR